MKSYLDLKFAPDELLKSPTMTLAQSQGFLNRKITCLGKAQGFLFSQDAHPIKARTQTPLP